MQDILGFELFGRGARRVIMMHDWFGDCSTWEPAKPYLSTQDLTYAFVDLRGYGKSRAIKGKYELDEAAGDVLKLTKHLDWGRFSVVGHSMSSMVMQRLLQLAPEQVAGAVAVTPVGPASLQLDDMMRGLAMADDTQRLAILPQMWGARLSKEWIDFKARRWSETAERLAAAAYVDMYGRADISLGAQGIKTPMLIVCGEQDNPPFRAAALEQTMLPYYPHAQIARLADSGHYPMQEQPPFFATVVERFLKDLP